jgi:hypothetical protein
MTNNFIDGAMDEDKQGQNGHQPESEPFDYTQWRQSLFEGVPLDEFLENARNFSENMVR